MNNANYQYHLKIILKSVEKPLIIEVRKDEYERLKVNLDNRDSDSVSRNFFNCSSMDGRFYSINIKHIQFVHYLWEPIALASDRLRSEGPIQVCLLNQKNLIEATSDSYAEVYNFFDEFELDSGEAFRGFTDIDGELLSFQISEIVYASTSEDIYEEGQKESEAALAEELNAVTNKI